MDIQHLVNLYFRCCCGKREAFRELQELGARSDQPLARAYVMRLYTYGSQMLESNKRLARRLSRDIIDWAKEHADKECPVQVYAEFILATCYAEGLSVVKDESIAFDYYTRSATRGYAGAQNNLGVCYSQGEGVDVNEEQANVWYKAAAEQGYPTAMDNLADSLFDGCGCTKNVTKALHWYQKAADAGFMKSTNTLAQIYIDGKGVSRDGAKAMVLLRKGEAYGSATSFFLLSHCYQYGIGVTRDLAQSLQYLKQCANLGDVDAQYKLGMYCLHGLTSDDLQKGRWHNDNTCILDPYDNDNSFFDLIPPDKVAGVRWLELAARQHHQTQACLALGEYYLERTDTRRHALLWLQYGLSEIANEYYLEDEMAPSVVQCHYLLGLMHFHGLVSSLPRGKDHTNTSTNDSNKSSSSNMNSIDKDINNDNTGISTDNSISNLADSNTLDNAGDTIDNGNGSSDKNTVNADYADRSTSHQNSQKYSKSKDTRLRLNRDRYIETGMEQEPVSAFAPDERIWRYRRKPLYPPSSFTMLSLSELLLSSTSNDNNSHSYDDDEEEDEDEVERAVAEEEDGTAAINLLGTSYYNDHTNTHTATTNSNSCNANNTSIMLMSRSEEVQRSLHHLQEALRLSVTLPLKHRRDSLLLERLSVHIFWLVTQGSRVCDLDTLCVLPSRNLFASNNTNNDNNIYHKTNNNANNNSKNNYDNNYSTNSSLNDTNIETNFSVISDSNAFNIDANTNTIIENRNSNDNNATVYATNTNITNNTCTNNNSDAAAIDWSELVPTDSSKSGDHVTRSRFLEELLCFQWDIQQQCVVRLSQPPRISTADDNNTDGTEKNIDKDGNSGPDEEDDKDNDNDSRNDAADNCETTNDANDATTNNIHSTCNTPSTSISTSTIDTAANTTTGSNTNTYTNDTSNDNNTTVDNNTTTSNSNDAMNNTDRSSTSNTTTSTTTNAVITTSATTSATNHHHNSSSSSSSNSTNNNKTKKASITQAVELLRTLCRNLSRYSNEDPAHACHLSVGHAARFLLADYLLNVLQTHCAQQTLLQNGGGSNSNVIHESNESNESSNNAAQNTKKQRQLQRWQRSLRDEALTLLDPHYFDFHPVKIINHKNNSDTNSVNCTNTSTSSFYYAHLEPSPLGVSVTQDNTNTTTNSSVDLFFLPPVYKNLQNDTTANKKNATATANSNNNTNTNQQYGYFYSSMVPGDECPAEYSVAGLLKLSQLCLFTAYSLSQTQNTTQQNTTQNIQISTPNTQKNTNTIAQKPQNFLRSTKQTLTQSQQQAQTLVQHYLRKAFRYARMAVLLLARLTQLPDICPCNTYQKSSSSATNETANATATNTSSTPHNSHNVTSGTISQLTVGQEMASTTVLLHTSSSSTDLMHDCHYPTNCDLHAILKNSTNTATSADTAAMLTVVQKQLYRDALRYRRHLLLRARHRVLQQKQRLARTLALAAARSADNTNTNTTTNTNTNNGDDSNNNSDNVTTNNTNHTTANNNIANNTTVSGDNSDNHCRSMVVIGGVESFPLFDRLLSESDAALHLALLLRQLADHHHHHHHHHGNNNNTNSNNNHSNSSGGGGTADYVKAAVSLFSLQSLLPAGANDNGIDNHSHNNSNNNAIHINNITIIRTNNNSNSNSNSNNNSTAVNNTTKHTHSVCAVVASEEQAVCRFLEHQCQRAANRLLCRAHVYGDLRATVLLAFLLRYCHSSPTSTSTSTSTSNASSTLYKVTSSDTLLSSYYDSSSMNNTTTSSNSSNSNNNATATNGCTIKTSIQQQQQQHENIAAKTSTITSSLIVRDRHTAQVLWVQAAERQEVHAMLCLGGNALRMLQKDSRLVSLLLPRGTATDNNEQSEGSEGNNDTHTTSTTTNNSINIVRNNSSNNTTDNNNNTNTNTNTNSSNNNSNIQVPAAVAAVAVSSSSSPAPLPLPLLSELVTQVCTLTQNTQTQQALRLGHHWLQIGDTLLRQHTNNTTSSTTNHSCQNDSTISGSNSNNSSGSNTDSNICGVLLAELSRQLWIIVENSRRK